MRNDVVYVMQEHRRLAAYLGQHWGQMPLRPVSVVDWAIAVMEAARAVPPDEPDELVEVLPGVYA